MAPSTLRSTVNLLEVGGVNQRLLGNGWAIKKKENQKRFVVDRSSPAELPLNQNKNTACCCGAFAWCALIEDVREDLRQSKG